MTDTVTPQREYGSKGGMGLIGWAMAIGIAFLLLPALPFLLVLYVVLRLAGSGKLPS